MTVQDVKRHLTSCHRDLNASHTDSGQFVQQQLMSLILVYIFSDSLDRLPNSSSGSKSFYWSKLSERT